MKKACVYFCACYVCLGKKLGFTIDLGKLHNVSLGQGQESVAELAMEKASREGHWVILQVCLCVCYLYILVVLCIYLMQVHAFFLEHSPGGKVAGKSREASRMLL